MNKVIEEQEKAITEKDSSTEEKILEAGRKLFTERGYAGTRTRDIAEEAGINLALLNYYFRSKENLFKIIMLEKVELFFGELIRMLKEDTTIDKKAEKIINLYFDMLSSNPDLPLFIFSETRYNENHSAVRDKMQTIVNDKDLQSLLKQMNPNVNPYHIIINFIGCIVFPYISKAIFDNTTVVKESSFDKLMETQKKIVPHILNAILSFNEENAK